MVSLVSFWNHKHHPCPVTLSQGAAAGLPYHTGSHLPAEIGPWPTRRRSSCATRSRTFCGVQPTYPSHTQTAQGRTASRPFNRIYTLIPSALTCWADWAGVWSSLNFAYLGHPNWSMYCVSNPGFCSNPRFCTKSSCGKHQMQENNSVGVISLSLTKISRLLTSSCCLMSKIIKSPETSIYNIHPCPSTEPTSNHVHVTGFFGVSQHKSLRWSMLKWSSGAVSSPRSPPCWRDRRRCPWQRRGPAGRSGYPPKQWQWTAQDPHNGSSKARIRATVPSPQLSNIDQFTSDLGVSLYTCFVQVDDPESRRC